MKILHKMLLLTSVLVGLSAMDDGGGNSVDERRRNNRDEAALAAQEPTSVGNCLFGGCMIVVSTGAEGCNNCCIKPAASCGTAIGGCACGIWRLLPTCITGYISLGASASDANASSRTLPDTLTSVSSGAIPRDIDDPCEFVINDIYLRDNIFQYLMAHNDPMNLETQDEWEMLLARRNRVNRQTEQHWQTKIFPLSPDPRDASTWNSTNGSCYTLMHEAASLGLPKALGWMLCHGAAVDPVWNGDTPLMAAAGAGNKECCRVLLENGADKTIQAQVLLEYNTNYKLVRYTAAELATRTGNDPNWRISAGLATMLVPSDRLLEVARFIDEYPTQA